MRNLAAFLALPAALLNAVAAHAQELQWPHNLPRTAKYYPRDEAHVKREIRAQERLRWHVPAGVKKMGEEDEGEKFFLDYWSFGDGEGGLGGDEGVLRGHSSLADGESCNVSDIRALVAAIAPHYSDGEKSYGHMRRSIFERDFKCPSGTYSCSAIGHDDLCCNTGETCVSTSDGVGCCPNGDTCGSQISGCESGYTSCPNSPNGGCCIPGASCDGTGCVLVGTRTTTRTLSIATTTTGASFTTETQSGRTVTIAYPTTEISIRVTTTTVTLRPSGQSSGSTITLSGEQCQAGFFSCPATEGGGCCPTGQACSADGTCPDSTTSATARSPVAATSQSVSVQTVAASSSSASTQEAGCPTGYYMCSAVYLGGCCRVGRNCHTTSCPPQDTTTLVSNPTVYVTGGNGGVTAAVSGGTCANGWYGCGADEDGGCCPSGYQCGVQSCTATNPGQRNTAKMAPSSAALNRWAWSFLGFGVVIGVGMVWL